MQYNPLNPVDRIEKTDILTKRIIVKALQSDRGDLIRVMGNAELKMLIESVGIAVHNKLEKEAQRAYNYNCDKYAIEQGYVVADPAPKFKPIPDVEIEAEVSAYFEIDGKLQYREVEIESIWLEY